MELTQNLMDLNTEEAKINFALENKKVSFDDRIKGLVHLRFRFSWERFNKLLVFVKIRKIN